jgi:hypothetical protein
VLSLCQNAADHDLSDELALYLRQPQNRAFGPTWSGTTSTGSLRSQAWPVGAIAARAIWADDLRPVARDVPRLVAPAACPVHLGDPYRDARPQAAERRDEVVGANSAEAGAIRVD